MNFSRRNLRWVFGVIILSFLGVNDSAGQDLHYSQFYNAPLTINPALTGIFNGDQRFMVSFRDQGRSIPVPYLTFSASYDRKIYPKKCNSKGFFGLGGFFNYDKQGNISNLTLFNLNLGGSYTHLLNEKNLITIGALVGYSNRGFDPDNLTWDNQWDAVTSTFNETLGGENFDFESFNFVETALGLNYRWQRDERTKLDLGVGAYHLLPAKARFNNDVDQDLPIRLAFYGIHSREVSDKLDVQFDVLYQLQNSYRELILGGYLNFYLNQQRGKNRQFRVGGGYRVNGKAPFFKFGLRFNDFFISASYDMDLSTLARDPLHDGGSGIGPEIHLNYIIKHVKPRCNFKVCPIF